MVFVCLGVYKSFVYISWLLVLSFDGIPVTSVCAYVCVSASLVFLVLSFGSLAPLLVLLLHPILIYLLFNYLIIFYYFYIDFT